MDTLGAPLKLSSTNSTTPTHLSAGVISPGLGTGLLEHDFNLHLFSDPHMDFGKVTSRTSSPNKLGRSAGAKASHRPSPLPLHGDIHGNLVDFHLDPALDMNFEDQEFPNGVPSYIHETDVVVPTNMTSFDDHEHFAHEPGFMLENIQLDHFDAAFTSHFGHQVPAHNSLLHGGNPFGLTSASLPSVMNQAFPNPEDQETLTKFMMGTTDPTARGARGNKSKSIRGGATTQKKRKGSVSKSGSGQMKAKNSSDNQSKKSNDSNPKSNTQKKRQRNKSLPASGKPSGLSNANALGHRESLAKGFPEEYYRGNSAKQFTGKSGQVAKAPRLTVDPHLPTYAMTGHTPSSARSTASTASRLSTPGSKSKQTSYFRGVSCCGKDRKWQARIRDANRVRYLGRYPTEVEAAFVYDRAARECKGANAPTNFVVLDPDMMDKIKAAFIEHGEIPANLHDLLAKGMRSRVENAMKKMKAAQAAASAIGQLPPKQGGLKARPVSGLDGRSKMQAPSLSTPVVVKGNQHFFPATPRRPAVKRTFSGNDFGGFAIVSSKNATTADAGKPGGGNSQLPRNPADLSNVPKTGINNAPHATHYSLAKEPQSEKVEPQLTSSNGATFAAHSVIAKSKALNSVLNESTSVPTPEGQFSKPNLKLSHTASGGTPAQPSPSSAC